MDPQSNRDVEAEAQHDTQLMAPNRQVSETSASKRSQTDDEINVRLIFDQYDTNKDGFLDTKEIKALIKAGQADDIRESVVRKILIRADEDNDGRLSFDEFLKMHKRSEWVLKDIAALCNTIVPHQQRRTNQMRPKHKPWLMILLTIVQFGLFWLSTASPLIEVLIFDARAKTQVWRFVSYMLVHSNWVHLIGNMVLQLTLGVPLEVYNGWWRVLVVYLAGGVAGCLGQAVFQNRNLTGASAGDFALLTAHIASVVLNWQELEHGLVQMFPCVVYCVIALIVALTDRENTNISHLAHLFGAIAGFLIGVCVLQNLVIQKWEKCMKAVSIASLTILFLIGGIYYYVAM